MSWRNAPENFFSAVRGCPRPCARTNPWFRGQILGGKCAQEPTPGSAVKHCRFLDTGGGGGTCFGSSAFLVHLAPLPFWFLWLLCLSVALPLCLFCCWVGCTGAECVGFQVDWNFVLCLP